MAVFDEEKHNELMKAGLKVRGARGGNVGADEEGQDLSFRATQAALLITLYGDQPQLHVPCELLRRLVSIDTLFAQWRHRHALVVQVRAGWRRRASS